MTNACRERSDLRTPGRTAANWLSGLGLHHGKGGHVNNIVHFRATLQHVHRL